MFPLQVERLSDVNLRRAVLGSHDPKIEGAKGVVGSSLSAVERFGHGLSSDVEVYSQKDV
jgi:hypothetical protein